MPEAEPKIPFASVQKMLAERLGIENAESIEPETILKPLARPGLNVLKNSRAGVVQLMGGYFEARSDEVDALFDYAVDVVHPLSTLAITLDAQTVHRVAERLYEILEKYN